MASVFSTAAAAVRNSIPAFRDAARALVVARERIGAIAVEYAAINRMLPSRDELVSLYTRHLDEDGFVADFKRWHVNETTVAQITGDTLEAHPGAHVLAVGTSSPNQASLIPAPTGSGAQPTMRALEFVLAPLLRTRIAELVDKALPPGYVGISTAERTAKKAKLSKERAELVEKITELESALAQAGVVVATPAKAGPSLTTRQNAEKIVADRLDDLIDISPAKAVDQVEAAL